jgi:hypothetical protein
MEKVPGIQLERLWGSMKIEDRFKIVRTLARHQKTWMSASFRQVGSLYYSRDIEKQGTGYIYIDSDGREVRDTLFTVGPSVGRDFFDNGRSAVEFDTGPCKTDTP